MKKKYLYFIFFFFAFLLLLFIGYKLFFLTHPTNSEEEKITIEYEQEKIDIIQQVDIQNILQLLSKMKPSDSKGKSLMYKGNYTDSNGKITELFIYSNGIQFGTDFYIGKNQKLIVQILQNYIDSIIRVEQFIQKSEQIVLRINDFDKKIILDNKQKNQLLSAIKDSSTSLDELPIFHSWKFPAYEIELLSSNNVKRHLALSNTDKLAYYYDDELLVFSCNDTVWNLITSWYPVTKEQWDGEFKELLTANQLLWTQNFPNVLVADHQDFTSYIDSIVRTLNSYSYTNSEKPKIKERKFYIRMNFISSNNNAPLIVYKNYIFYQNQWQKTNENISDILTGIVYMP